MWRWGCTSCYRMVLGDSPSSNIQRPPHYSPKRLCSTSLPSSEVTPQLISLACMTRKRITNYDHYQTHKWYLMEVNKIFEVLIPYLNPPFYIFIAFTFDPFIQSRMLSIANFHVTLEPRSLFIYKWSYDNDEPLILICYAFIMRKVSKKKPKWHQPNR